MIYIISIISAITGFLFGFDEGIIAGAISIIRNEFYLNDVLIGLLMGILPLGALMSSLVAGMITDYLGRQKTLIAVAVAPMYIAETAPAKMRGRLVSCYQLAITFGILCSYLINYVFIEHLAWRSMFIVGLVPALLLLLGALFLPESPRWLFLKGKYQQAHRVFRQLHMTGLVDASAHKHEVKPLAALEVLPQIYGH